MLSLSKVSKVSGAPFFVVVSVCFHGSESLVCARDEISPFSHKTSRFLIVFLGSSSSSLFFVSLSFFLSEKETDLAGAAFASA